MIEPMVEIPVGRATAMRDEIVRLRTALALVLDEMEACEGRQGMWEDGIDPDYRRAIEHGRAVQKMGTIG